jgi:formamidopyrimidine-DNA glycosylase
MPELPEVENIAQGLRSEIINLCITDIYINKPAIVKGLFKHNRQLPANELAKSRITDITRRGKRLIINTDKDLSILIQLGMTGKFVITDPNIPYEKHTHFYIKLNNNKELRFVDPRRFGRVWFFENNNGDLEQAMITAGLSKMGPEPFDFRHQSFHQILASKRLIKTLLLDQTRIAGLGNIYVDESLFAARIHPATICNKIAYEKSAQLLKAIKTVLKHAIAGGGTTFSDFRNAYGDMGSFKKRLCVYDRDGLPCKICQTTINKIVIAGRGTHFCPSCQPIS